MIITVDQSIIRPENWGSVVEQAANLESELGNYEKALENKDLGLIGDMIQKEIQPTFELFGKEIKIAIDREGMRGELN